MEQTQNGTYEVPASTTLSDLQPFSITDLESLENADVAPIDLTAEYWTPSPGEIRRVIFDRIELSNVQSISNPDETVELETAFFITKDEDTGAAKQIMNGSKRLVGALQSHNIKWGTGLEITYLGKQKNKTNNFSSDSWSIKPLIKKAQIQKQAANQNVTDDLPF